MKNNSGGRHIVDFLFTLALFCVFAASALAVVSIGARVYRQNVSNMTDTFSERTALAYIEQKFRQGNAEDSIFVTTVGGSDALALRSGYNGDNFITYIYCCNGYLCELFIKEGYDFSPEDGQQLLELDSLEITKKGNMYCFRTESPNGSGSVTLYSACN